MGVAWALWQSHMVRVRGADAVRAHAGFMMRQQHVTTCTPGPEMKHSGHVTILATMLLGQKEDGHG